MMKVAAIITGCFIVGGATHAAIMTGGGYGGHEWIILASVGLGLVVGSICVGMAMRERRKALAWVLCIALAAGELFGLINTAERVISTRENAQAPFVSASLSRKAAEQRVARAETSKAAADRAVIDKAADKGCAANCRKLLQDQVDAATTEIEAARHALAGLPSPRVATPLADRLGLPSWALDLIAATLASIAANGLGAALIAFGAHRQTGGHVMPPVVAMAEQPAAAPIECPVTSAPIALAPPLSPREHAAEFIRASLRRDPSSSVDTRALYEVYRSWCAENQIEPLPSIGIELGHLFKGLGLAKEGDAIQGARLAERERIAA